jgi:hypothetical protein
MNLIKGEYGVIEQDKMEATDRRIAQATTLMGEIDRIVQTETDPDARDVALIDLKHKVDNANLSTVCDKRELEIDSKGTQIKFLQAAALMVGDWWREKVGINRNQ